MCLEIILKNVIRFYIIINNNLLYKRHLKKLDRGKSTLFIRLLSWCLNSEEIVERKIREIVTLRLEFLLKK